MILTDRMTFDAPKRTKEGYMAVRARSARIGIQDYMGYEVDPDGTRFAANDVVKVYRPESEVMAEKSVRSFIGRPVTDGHPPEAVNSSNWKQYSDGVIMGAMRDGDHLAFDIVFMDEKAVNDIQTGGPRELSNGYGVDLSFEDGVTPSGEIYQAVQRNIVGNHVARVPKGRAGPTCAIAACDVIPDAINLIPVNLGDDDMTTKPVKITIDGASHTVELSDAAAILVGQMQTALDRQATELAAAQTTIGTMTAAASTKDGEIAALTKRVKDAEAVDVDTLVANRAAVVDAAKKIFPDVVTDKKSDADIRKQAVAHKLGDAAANMDDNGIAGAFAAFAASVTDGEPDTLRDGLRAVDKSTKTNDAHAGYQARLTRQSANAA